MNQLGPLAWPLLICSIIALALILERALFYLGLYRLTSKRINTLLDLAENNRWGGLSDASLERNGLLQEGIYQLLSMQSLVKSLREEKMMLWLTAQRRRLFANLKWLTLIAVVSPLLGLLGTVLGMIRAFRDIAVHSGPIHPALLADGLQQAMQTTAVGLMIAIPALVCVHAFKIWGGSYLETLEHVFSEVNLSMLGVMTDTKQTFNSVTNGFAERAGEAP